MRPIRPQQIDLDQGSRQFCRRKRSTPLTGMGAIPQVRPADFCLRRSALQCVMFFQLLKSEAPMSQNGIAASLAALLVGLSFCAGAAPPSSARAYAQLETPVEHDRAALSADERRRLREELTRARDRQNDRVKAKESAPAARPKKR